MDGLQTLLARLGPEGVLALGIIFLIFNAVLRGLQIYLGQRDKKEERDQRAGGCGYSADLATLTRDVAQRAQRQEDATDRLESSVDRMAGATQVLAEKIVEALAELRAERGARVGMRR